ncbi:peptidylprolyl isomerase [Kitasatospora humi]|uniref:peptidylprolyl isomerase n=1 Tax=Kitasatospora humi TaxID=2893891 RepID=UPI0024BFD2D9|nr:peptidylprolyl isomerase [Kitasatospora humi]
MPRNRLTVAAAAATLVLAATSAASAATVTPDAKPAAAAPVAAADCGFTKAVPADDFKGIPVFDPVKAAQPYHATLHTGQGNVTFQALTTAAPCTTFSFRFLSDHHYYNGSHCHRLTTKGIFVLQCGDPTGTGSGGPGYSFNDENLAGATYPAGTVAMANAGPNTNGSQFFFVWQDTKLPPAYTPFGKVTAGLDVLRKIAAAGEDDQNGPGDGFPTLPVDIHAVQITKH